MLLLQIEQFLIKTASFSHSHNRYKLRCLVQARSNGVVHVTNNYATFLVGSEPNSCMLTVAEYSGNAELS